ncbi:MAG TPA: hypothetical protein VI874_03810, partial [Candidatus Norongarragalinales archaeon]|nr:hypothetical protein [Candidatus Norongarragalinales archaeon]
YTAAFLSDCVAGELADFAATFRNVSLKDEVFFSVDFAKLKELAFEKAIRVEDLDGVKAVFEEYTFLVRASKTEPKVRINVEAKSEEKAKIGMAFVLDLLKRART